jgi:small-conductance mechanosensitive channel
MKLPVVGPVTTDLIVIGVIVLTAVIGVLRGGQRVKALAFAGFAGYTVALLAGDQLFASFAKT